jgi:hypothetical protein
LNINKNIPLILATLALLGLFNHSTSAFANEISESQLKWHAKYKKQKNAPDPQKQLINLEKEPDLSTGFESLYNKKNLEGWVIKGGHCTFEAQGEVIVGTCVKGSPSTYLSTIKEDYKDFIFSCEMFWEVNGNTGVMFRAMGKMRKNQSVEVVGPQAEMEGLTQGRGWSGGIFGQACGGYYYPLWLEAHKEARAALTQDWNRITIKAKGPEIRTWINGIPAAHLMMSDYPQGFFGLQIHSGKSGKVQFPNLIVKEL